MYLSADTSFSRFTHSIHEEIAAFEKAYSEQLQPEAPFLGELISHIGKGRGKRLRPILFFLSQGLVSRPSVGTARIAVLLELLHTATLIHDDVLDNSSDRRGFPTLNALWGERVSILMGDYLFAKVLQLGVDTDRPEILRIIARAVKDMGRGELWQTLKGNDEGLTPEEYYDLIRDKTAGLFSAACELGGIAAGADPDQIERLRLIGEGFGLAFQIRDDVLDLTGIEERLGKPVGQDVTNGKMTLPCILALQDADEDERGIIMDHFKKASNESVRCIVQFIKEREGVEKALEEARRWIAGVNDRIESFSPSVYRESLKELVLFGLRRRE